MLHTQNQLDTAIILHLKLKNNGEKGGLGGGGGRGGGCRLAAPSLIGLSDKLSVRFAKKYSLLNIEAQAYGRIDVAICINCAPRCVCVGVCVCVCVSVCV